MGWRGAQGAGYISSMEEDDAREIILNLLNGLEQCIVEIAALSTTVTLLCDTEMARALTESAKAQAAKRASERFRQLRGMLLGESAGSHSEPAPAGDWQEAVRRLIESAKDVDLSED